MDLAALIDRLKPLCDDPHAHWDEIADLLDEDSAVAEYEVARFYVARAIGGEIEPRLRSPDPRERLRAIRMVGLTYPRAAAGRVVRRVFKDPDPRVRAHARYVANRLGLDDVALPDTFGEGGGWGPGPHIGEWNRTGWAFGTFRYTYGQPTRKSLLKQYGLPPLTTKGAVAKLVGVARVGELDRLMRPGCGQGAPYVEFEIAKASPAGSGSTRRIAAPRHELKKVQQVILRKVLAKLPVHDACHGFVPGRSTVSNAEPHQGARVVVKMDLIDFFPSVHYRRVVGLFMHYGYNYDVAQVLAGLTCHRPVMDDGTVAWPGVLPQGAPTSPAIANLVCRRLDTRLANLAAGAGAAYTRYADDLTFSFPREPAGGMAMGRFIWWVDQICQQEGFGENPKKRRVLRPGNQQRVTGIIVNSGLTVPRADRRRFRAILANCRKHGVASQARGRADFADYLRGFAAYVKMVQPGLGAELVREVDEILASDARGAGS